MFLRNGLLLAFLVIAGAAQAASTYTYDPNGRLVSATNELGQAAVYRYDALGNILRIDRYSAGDLAIYSFSPTHAAPGASVIVQGQGFLDGGTTAAFGGTTASVTSVNGNQFVATVPAGAITGPISVTVGANIATSAEDFVIDGGHTPPQIISVSPLIVDSGNAVTVIGTHFLPVAGATSVTLNGKETQPTLLSDGQAVFPASTLVSSGKVSVTTPFGRAVSANDVLVLPSGVTAASLDQHLRTTLGGIATVTIPTSKYAAILFDAAVGDWISLQVNSLTTTSNRVDYYLYNPRNERIDTNGLFGNTRTAHFPQFKESGTYLLLVVPNTAPATLEFGLERAPTISASTPGVTVVTAANFQSKRILIEGVEWQRSYLGFSGASTTSVYNDFKFTLTDRFGVPLSSGTCVVPACGANLIGPAVSGPIPLVLSPDGAATFSVTISVAPAVEGKLDLDTPLQRSTSGIYQAAYLTFEAVQGQNLGLGLTYLTANRVDAVSITRPDGTYFIGKNCTPTTAGRCELNLAKLPETGTYLVTVSAPQNAAMSFTAVLSEDQSGSLSPDVPLALNLAQPGQNARLDFAGTAGQRMGLRWENMVLSPNGTVGISVTDPDGKAVASWNLGAGTSFVNLTLPQKTGNYRVFVDPWYAATLVGSVRQVSEASGTVALGESASLAAAYAGQNVYLHFNGVPGQRLGIGLTALSGSGTWGIGIYRPDGVYLGSGTCAVSSVRCELDLPVLPVVGGGTMYEMVVSAGAGVPIGFTATLAEDQIIALNPGVPAALHLALPGQNGRLTFTGMAAQLVKLDVADLLTSPLNTPVRLKITDPDGATVSSPSLPNGTSTVNLALPKTGSYSIFVDPDAAATATATVTLSPQ